VSGGLPDGAAEPRHRATIEIFVCGRPHGWTADSAAVVALVTGVGRHGGLPGTYWSGGRLSHLLEHLPYRL
jgi:hypothetical protein